MAKKDPLAVVLKELLDSAGRRPSDVVRLVERAFGPGWLPSATLDRWLSGETERPRDWRPIAAIAVVLKLPFDEADRLLASASQPDLATQREADLEPEDRERFLDPLLRWSEDALRVSQVRVRRDEQQLEFFVHNDGTRDVIILRLRVTLKHLRVRRTLSFLEPSHEYDFDVSELDREGKSLSHDLAQLVKAGETDRFLVRLTLGSEEAQGQQRSLRLLPELETDRGAVVVCPEVEVKLPV